MMRLLADENVSRLIVERLRAADFDVKSIGATIAGASDTVVLAIATDEGRILIAEDRDFGEMVVRQRLGIPGSCFWNWIACRTWRKQTE
jgi:predicted nuclease of predicted toxin-antitoxin system